MIWGARGLHFGRLFGSLFRPKRENEEVCLDCTGVCGLHIQLGRRDSKLKLFRGLFQGSILGGLRGEIFGDFDDFGIPGGDHLAPKSHQKMRPKKRLKKGSAGHAGNRLWAP